MGEGKGKRVRVAYVERMLMKSEGEEAVAESLERMKTTRSSGRSSKRLCLSFLLGCCFNGLLMFLHSTKV